jgi:aminodeoxychorismate synthase component I
MVVSTVFRGLKHRVNAGAVLIGSKGGWSSKGGSVVCLEAPDMFLTFQDGLTVIRAGTEGLRSSRDPLVVLQEILGRGYIAVGYLGYEFFEFLQSGFMLAPGKDGFQFPQASFMLFDENKYQNNKVYEWEDQASVDLPPGQPPRPNMSKMEFIQMVEKARRYIAEGDVYQVNLSQKFEVPFKIPSEVFLRRLYQAQPVPFACCLDFGGFKLLSGSMELFLRKSGRRLTTRPIKGTRRRGGNRREDEELRLELLESEKERAENLMIVDLMRNDLGRVCEFGSVRAKDLFKVETYSTLHQLVSEVGGRLRDGITMGDIIRSTFPPGSVTGAPKRRAMEIIDELEPHLRGPYCGAVGIFTPDGDFTLSVAIRVLAAAGGVGTFWVGGGIMWDSVPELEYEETLVKAQAMMKALSWM